MPTMLLDPGALRSLFSLQQQQSVSDGMGGWVSEWVEQATLYGLIEPVSQTSAFGPGQTQDILTHRITVRWRDGVVAGMRLARMGRTFEILTVHDPDESGRYLVCRVREARP